MLTASMVGVSPSSCRRGDDPPLTGPLVIGAASAEASLVACDWVKLWLGVKGRSGAEFGVEGWDPGEDAALPVG